MERTLGAPRTDQLSRARLLGLDGLELEIHGDAPVLAEDSRRCEVAVCSVICGGDGLGAPDAAVRRAAIDQVRAAFDDAVAVGADTVLLPHFGLTASSGRADGERFVEDLRACLESSRRHPVMLAWEGALDADATRRTVEAVGSPRLRCCVDFGNCAKYGRNPAAEIRVLGGLIVRAHAKNLNKQPLDAPGVDLPACLQALCEVGYDRWLVLETPPAGDPMAAAAHNLAVLRGAWAGVSGAGG